MYTDFLGISLISKQQIVCPTIFNNNLIDFKCFFKVTILLATSLIVQLDVLLRLLVRFLVIYFKLMKNKVNWY